MATNQIQLAPFDIEKQIHHYRFILSSLKKSPFLKKNRFYVLPTLYESGRERTVYLPRLNNINITKRIMSFPLTSPLPKELKIELSETISSIYSKRKLTYSALLNEVSNNMERLSEITKVEFPKEKLSDIEIHIKLFGTTGSYHLQGDTYDSYNANRIILSPRYDSDINRVIYLILLSLVHKYNFPMGIQDSYNIWKNKQDMAHSLYNKYFPKSKSLIDILSKTTIAKLAKESKLYLEELGTPINDIAIKDLKGIVPEKEYRAINAIYKASPNAITFTDLFREVWREKSCGEYSQYAVTKLIERVRSELYNAGISPQFIHTDRGKGYSWY